MNGYEWWENKLTYLNGGLSILQQEEREPPKHELPYWLRIGPICWDATYRVGYTYVKFPSRKSSVEYPNDTLESL